MLRYFPLISLVLAFMVSACSGVETQIEDTDEFEAGNYRYYKWRSEPLSTAVSDPVHMGDAVVRRAVDKELAKKGYILNPDKAQFSVDYAYAEGLRTSEPSSTITSTPTYPGTVPTREIDQASIDNAVALTGIKEVSHLGLQFNDVQSRKEVWRAVGTKLIERVNSTDMEAMKDTINVAVEQMLRTMPSAAN